MPILQVRQTIISTASVGAIFAFLSYIFAFYAFRSDYPNQKLSLISEAGEFAIYFIICVLFCVFVFGLLPMAIQNCFIWLVRRWKSRA